MLGECDVGSLASPAVCGRMRDHARHHRKPFGRSCWIAARGRVVKEKERKNERKKEGKKESREGEMGERGREGERERERESEGDRGRVRESEGERGRARESEGERERGTEAEKERGREAERQMQRGRDGSCLDLLSGNYDKILRAVHRSCRKFEAHNLARWRVPPFSLWVAQKKPVLWVNVLASVSSLFRLNRTVTDSVQRNISERGPASCEFPEHNQEGPEETIKQAEQI